jgi:hypothetical protein
MLKDKKFLIILGLILFSIVLSLCSFNQPQVTTEDGVGARTSDDQWDNDGSDIYYIDGNTGFGTSKPNEALSVASSGLQIFELGYPENITVATTAGGSLLADTWYFKVTSNNGNGETRAVTEQTCILTGTVPGGGCDITFDPIVLADYYNIWVSSTTNNFVYYFSTTTIPAFIGTTTSALVGTIPSATSAYVNQIGSNANNYFIGNSTGFGTSSPNSFFHITQGSTATTVVEFGEANAIKGTCIQVYSSNGTAIRLWWQDDATAVVEAGTCLN